MSGEPGKEIALRINTAFEENRLTEGARNVLSKTSSVTSLDLGAPVTDLYSEEILLATVMPDDSTSQNRIVRRKTPIVQQGSSRSMLEGEIGRGGLSQYEIREVGPDNPESNAEATRIGHNAVVDALRASPRSDQVLFATRFLNGQLLNPFSPLSAVQKLDRYNFRPNRGTPLYDQTVELMKMVLAKYEQCRADYREPRTATLLVTDGLDQHSRIQTPASVAEVIRSMRSTGHHIVAAMGIDDGETDFRKVFTAMGIDPKWILTPGSTQQEIQAAFGLFAKAASQATDPKNFPLMLTSGFDGITEV